MDVIIATIKASPLLCLGVPVVLFAIMLAMGRPEPSEAQQAGQNGCGVIAIVVGAIFAAVIIYAVLTTSEHAVPQGPKRVSGSEDAASPLHTEWSPVVRITAPSAMSSRGPDG